MVKPPANPAQRDKSETPRPRRARLPPASAGNAVDEGSAGATQPELPAVRIQAAAYSLPPDMSGVGGPSPSAVTDPEIPAVKPVDGERSSFSTVPPYDDDEITSEIVRRTDYGAPPPVPVDRDRTVLLRMDGVNAGQVESVRDEPLTIGRHPSNGISICDGGISRQHARVLYGRGGHFIEDLGSRNGTYVQGRRVARAKLHDGDWIQLGPRVSFRYSITDAKQERLLRQLFESSTRDALTGAYNRQHFEERLRTEIAYAVRHSTNVSLVLFDLDHFKHINDNYGHQAGDAVLRSVAAAISARLRAEDVFARFGGEEFAVVLRGIGVASALCVGERLRNAVAAAVVNHRGISIQVTISAGVAALSECCRPTGVELVGVADRRLYVAKDGGRNRVVADD